MREIEPLLRPLKKKQARKKKTAKKTAPYTDQGASETGTSLSKEALMTLVAIMKEQDDPRLQLSAAKTLLQKTVLAEETQKPPEDVAPNEIDAAIALAKKLLDALASGKTASFHAPRELDTESAAEPDNAGR